MRSLRDLALALLVGGAFAQEPPQAPQAFDWSTIEPSETLRYHPCHDDHYCARLTVPLDWLNPSNPHNVTIALVKRPAAVPSTSPTFGGPVLLNPGGPGGSGVELALNWGSRLQGILDGAKHYEIIGFDPRGVGATTPRADCYPDKLARAYEAFQKHGAGFLRADNMKLGWRHELARAYARRCEGELGGEGGILEFAGTASVARDMVEIIDRIQELHEEEAREVGVPSAEQKKLGGEDGSEKEVARLQYIGFSYGTLLGNTFASMFPGRVGRMVLDGVADIDDYMAGTWITNMQDTDAAVDYLYQVCFHMDSCPLSDGTEETWEDIKAKVESAISPLEHAPIPLDTAHASYALSETDVRALILMTLYRPSLLFPISYAFLGALLKDNRPHMAAILDALVTYPTASSLCMDCPANPTCPAPASPDAQSVIACSDGDSPADLTIPEWTDYFLQLRNQSTIGTPWSEVRFHCAGWTARPRYRFTGPFSTPAYDPSLAEGKPAAPLLFMSSRVDPVTPLRNAYAMAARHPGSGVLVQESVGHCALGSGVSSCTDGVVRAYFEDGTVPEEGTACAEDCGEFELCVKSDKRTAPIPLFGRGGLEGGGGLDLGRMEDLSFALAGEWQQANWESQRVSWDL